MTTPLPLNIAILINHPPGTTFYPEVRQAFINSFAELAPHAQIDCYDPIVKNEYPEPSKHDLVILSGGKADASASDPWILQMMDFVRRFVDGQDADWKRTKMVGICWGHQLIARALGGVVDAVLTGPVAGLVRVGLTTKGNGFFPLLAEKGSYLASQFHVREVSTSAPGFVALAENNEAFVSESNRILSFQAHPEIDGVFARMILEDGDTTYTGGRTEEEVREMIRECAGVQDGMRLLDRVVEWVRE